MMFIFRYGTDSNSTLIESVSCSSNYLVLLQCNWESQYSSSCADDDKDVVVICCMLLADNILHVLIIVKVTMIVAVISTIIIKGHSCSPRAQINVHSFTLK